MTAVKQILVVDDHFEMLQLLRSLLELSDQECQVLAVPSAEEGFMELRRTPFDLVISDVRLPGMSGFELVRRIQQVRPTVPIIIITAYSSDQGKKEAEELGVYRYFRKPLDTDALLAAVHTALNGEVSRPALKGAPLPPLQPEQEPAQKGDGVAERLRSLRVDTGATQVVLADLRGDIVRQVGAQGSLDFRGVGPALADNIASALRLAEQLDGSEPRMIQYQAGKSFDLYSANVGLHHFVALVFDVEARRGRIGTVWIFAQRAIRDLKQMLPATAEAEAQPPLPLESIVLPTTEREPSERESSLSGPEEVEPVGDVGDEGGGPLESGDEEGLFELFGQEALASEDDLDAFWDGALEEEQMPPESGLSFEEALRRGLIPPQFGRSDQ